MRDAIISAILFGVFMGVAVGCGIAFLRRHPRTLTTMDGSILPVQWADTRDWTSTDQSGVVHRIEFGFRADGVLLWRKAEVAK